TLRRIANRRGRVVGGVHHELTSHRVALRGSHDGLRLENGDTARMGHEREHTGLVCLATGALRLRIPLTGLSPGSRPLSPTRNLQWTLKTFLLGRKRDSEPSDGSL